MPNHCDTTMHVNGPADDVEQFHQTIEPSEQFIPALIPMPVELEGEVGWYEWQLDNWGCKWGDVDTEIDAPPYLLDDGTAYLTVRFWTAWGPALEGLTTISAMFPTLRFEISYEDECGNFYGFAVFVNGRFGDCSVNPDDPHYPQFTGDDDENSAELVGQCFDYCGSRAVAMLDQQLESVG